MLLDYQPAFQQSGGPAPFNTLRLNLTCLANVRTWLGSSTSTDDVMLKRLIGEASRTILNYLQRADIGLSTITETISGRGEQKIQLRNWPVVEVSSLSVNGVSIPASAGPNAYGYFLEPVYGSLCGRPQNVGIVGGAYLAGGVILSGPYASFGGREYAGGRGPFPRGVGNISVQYGCGYCARGEAQTVPETPGPYAVTPNAVYGPWNADNGVSYADGTPLTAVASNPGYGQYVAPNLAGATPTLDYLFSGADAGAAILLNYNYVPYDLEQACIEMVGERYRYRLRIGQISQSLGGQETASYMVRDGLTAAIKQRLDPYRVGWLG